MKHTSDVVSKNGHADEAEFPSESKEVECYKQLKKDELFEEELTLEDLAPDGGWGWLVAFGFVITFTAMMTGMQCSAIIFKDLYEATGQAGVASSIVTSLIIFSSSLAGLLINILLKNYSMRSIGIVGSLLYTASWVICILATNIYQLSIIVFGLGFGIGIMLNIANTNFNFYFVKRRATVMAGGQIIVSFFCAICPIFIGNMTEIYGYQGSLLIFAALSASTILAMFFMHPIEWHLKDRNQVLAERRKIIAPPQKSSTETESKVTNGVTRWSSLECVEKTGEHQIPLLVEVLKEKLASNSQIHKEILKRSMHSLGSQYVSVSSLVNVGVPVEIPFTEKQLTKEEKIAQESQRRLGIKKLLLDIFDMTLLKDRVFIITCFGVSFGILSDIIFLIQLPIAMYEQGYSVAGTANALAVASGAEFATKILLMIMTMFVDVRAKVVFFVAMISMTFVKLAFYFCATFPMGLMITFAITGVVRVFIMVPHPLVIVEGQPSNKYAACFGIYSMIQGCSLIIANLSFGVLKDNAGFDVCQIILIVINCIFILPWGMDLISYYKNKSKQNVVSDQRKIDAASHC